MSYTVSNNKERNRFELTAEGKTAFLDYDIKGDSILLLHTEVPDAIGGKGAGGALAGYALKHAQEHGLMPKVYCSFVTAYLKRHPEAGPDAESKTQ